MADDVILIRCAFSKPEVRNNHLLQPKFEVNVSQDSSETSNFNDFAPKQKTTVSATQQDVQVEISSFYT